MSRFRWFPILTLAVVASMASLASAQTTYIGYVYPAGGQQGTTFQVRVGGQRLDYVDKVHVSGEGVSASVVKYYRVLSNQEVTLIREQQRELQKAAKGKGKLDQESVKMLEDIRTRIAGWVNRPACSSISAITIVEVTIDSDAEPGMRELRLGTVRGISNPLAFQVGQVPEVARKAMKTATFQVLGKEALAQRKRPPEEEEETITLPCTMNGQIASGEVNRYRFTATKGQRLVISAKARELIPYIADAVPGWFQPVLALHDTDGKEVAFNDDYRFKPDPTMYYEIPKDGEYVLSITDAIYRGREDFVYRVTVSEMPFVTSIFPLGGRVGEPASIEMDGWNLQDARLTPPPRNAESGVHMIAAKRQGVVSNSLPFALDTLPECLDEEDNNVPAKAQEVKLPIIVNGRMDRPDDWDVFRVTGRAGDKIVAEVQARRLDSPLDSLIKLTDESGKLLAFNDDCQDVGSGLNTHHADSYLMIELPADGTYYFHLGDASRCGGKEYAYRLRLSAPRPDFELRVVPSALAIRSKATGAVSVYAIRKDGFDAPIRLSFNDLPKGLASNPVTLAPTKDMVRLAVKTTMTNMEKPIQLSVKGSAKVGEEEVVHEAVPAEDRMQAFLWRHLVPANELLALVYNASYTPPPVRVPPPTPEKTDSAEASEKPAAPPKFSKKQVTGRLRQLKRLYEEWLLTDEFHARKVAECEASL